MQWPCSRRSRREHHEFTVGSAGVDAPPQEPISCFEMRRPWLRPRMRHCFRMAASARAMQVRPLFDIGAFSPQVCRHTASHTWACWHAGITTRTMSCHTLLRDGADNGTRHDTTRQVFFRAFWCITRKPAWPARDSLFYAGFDGASAYFVAMLRAHYFRLALDFAQASFSFCRHAGARFDWATWRNIAGCFHGHVLMMLRLHGESGFSLQRSLFSDENAAGTTVFLISGTVQLASTLDRSCLMFHRHLLPRLF